MSDTFEPNDVVVKKDHTRATAEQEAVEDELAKRYGAW